MRKSTLGLFISILCGAGLMACSAETGDAEAQTQMNVDESAGQNSPADNIPSQQSSKTSYHNDAATVTFANDQSCITTDSGSPAPILLTNGTTVILRDIWLNSVIIPDAGAHKVDMGAEDKSKISEVFFELPTSYNAQGCAKTVTTGIYETERSLAARAMKAEGAYSPFMPMFGPSYGFAKVPKSEVNSFFKTHTTANTLSNVTVQSLKGVEKRPPEFRPRWTEGQMSRQATIRVAYVPYETLDTGRICLSGKSHCAYYDVARHYTDPQLFTTKILFYMPLTNSLTAEFEREVDNEAGSIKDVMTPEMTETIVSIMDALQNLEIKE